MYCYNVLRENLLDLLLEKLQSSILTAATDENRMSWQSLEACLHGFVAIAESVGTTENVRLQMFFYLLHTLPFDKLNIRVAITALDAIGMCTYCTVIFFCCICTIELWSFHISSPPPKN